VGSNIGAMDVSDYQVNIGSQMEYSTNFIWKTRKQLMVEYLIVVLFIEFDCHQLRFVF
jgi:hypothetical protein